MIEVINSGLYTPEELEVIEKRDEILTIQQQASDAEFRVAAEQYRNRNEFLDLATNNLAITSQLADVEGVVPPLFSDVSFRNRRLNRMARGIVTKEHAVDQLYLIKALAIGVVGASNFVTVEYGTGYMIARHNQHEYLEVYSNKQKGGPAVQVRNEDGEFVPTFITEENKSGFLDYANALRNVEWKSYTPFIRGSIARYQSTELNDLVNRYIEGAQQRYLEIEKDAFKLTGDYFELDYQQA